MKTRGPCSKYEIPGKKGDLKFYFGGHLLSGIACNRDSPAYKAICTAIDEVKGSCVPYSICGSLPLVGDMQEAGFDIQLIGFGKSSVYHADNEYCLLSDMADAVKILTKVIDTIIA